MPVGAVVEGVTVLRVREETVAGRTVEFGRGRLRGCRSWLFGGRPRGRRSWSCGLAAGHVLGEVAHLGGGVED